MENQKKYSPFKEIKLVNAYDPSEKGFVEIEYTTKAHPESVFRGFVRPAALEKFGNTLESGNKYSIITDGEYVNYVAFPKW